MTFYYDPTTHYFTSTAQGPILTVPGSDNSELGCSGDWMPDCLKSWLQDPDGDGTYTFTDARPARRARTRSRSRTTSAGTRTTAPAACAGRREHPVLGDRAASP